MNNQLIVIAHPFSNNLNNILLSSMKTLYGKLSQNIVLRDLYELNFNPVVTKADINAVASGSASDDVLIEQEYVRQADIISFIYPIWWTGMPAIMKGYIDRVFTKGFAYSQNKLGISQPLKGKKIVIVNTSGEPENWYIRGGMYDSRSISCERNIFDFLGMDVILHYVIEKVNENSDLHALKNAVDILKLEIRKSMLLNNNSRLTIPTPF